MAAEMNAEKAAEKAAEIADEMAAEMGTKMATEMATGMARASHACPIQLIPLHLVPSGRTNYTYQMYAAIALRSCAAIARCHEVCIRQAEMATELHILGAGIRNGHGGVYAAGRSGYGGVYTADQNGYGSVYTAGQNGHTGIYAASWNGDEGVYAAGRNSHGGNEKADEWAKKGTVMQGKEGAAGSGVRQRVKAWRKEKREVEGFGGGKVMEWNRIAVSNFTAWRLKRGRCAVWLKRIGAAESDKCRCGEVQTGEHLAFRCRNQKNRPEGFERWGDTEKNWKRKAENGEEYDVLENFFAGVKF
ncbi:hypothetical protein BDZ91DRAFT_802972 [Kalaharituber pfeilii]|nr:hypothetical protein BDZ91DRAFT_802972 [Kalaharituber pfeilii]